MVEWIKRAVLILTGLAFVGCEVYGAYEYLWAKFGHWNYLVVGGLLLTGGTAILPAAAEFASEQGARAKKWGAWFAIPLSLAFVFTVSIERTGSVTDTDEAARRQSARALQIAESEMAEAQAQRVKDQAAIDNICGVWGPKCSQAKEDLRATERKLTEARAVVKKQGVVVDESMAKRLMAVLPFLTKETIQLYHPMLLPLSLALVGAMLLSIGCHKKAPPAVPPLDAPEKQTTPEPVVEPAAPKKAPARPKLVVTNSDLVVTLVPLLQKIAGPRSSIVEVHKAYTARCREQSRKPLADEEFGVALEAFCRETGIKTKTIKGMPYLLDVQLAAATKGPQALSASTP